MKRVEMEIPIVDASLPRPMLRLEALAQLFDRLQELQVDAVEEPKVRVVSARQVIRIVVGVKPMGLQGDGMVMPKPTVTLCPSCHAVIAGVNEVVA